MDIKEKINSLIEYIIKYVEKIKNLIDGIIDYLIDLRDRIDGLLDFVHEKLQQAENIVGGLQSENAA